MAYSDFDLERLEREFHLTIEEVQDLYAGVPAASVDAAFAQLLAEYVPLGLAIHTEKARSEYIIAPVLAEVRRMMNHRISVFSGIELNADAQSGLTGVCDFLLSRSPAQMFLRTPIVAVVEAKREDIKSGIPQCIAAMLGAQRFNQAHGESVVRLYGAVTSGDNWKFLQVERSHFQLDVMEYLIADVGKILGILKQMVGDAPAP